jgi:uncharacterized protein (TIGR01244 family)
VRRLDETTLIATRQLYPADLQDVAGQALRLIVNNRPDGEEPRQPASAAIEAAARAAGFDYRHIPVAGGFPAEQVEEMAEALEQGPVLAFCRSGTRSTCLWALARFSRGADAEILIRKAAAVGFDLRPLAPYLTR